jgi:hypothetical protein
MTPEFSLRENSDVGLRRRRPSDLSREITSEFFGGILPENSGVSRFVRFSALLIF